MVRVLNTNKKEHLKNELRLEFPNLTDAEMNSIDNSFDQLISNIAAKSDKSREDIAKIVENKLDYVHSKHVF